MDPGDPRMPVHSFRTPMTNRLLAISAALGIFASVGPASAADAPSVTITAPTEIPCGGTSGKARARCITDAIKTWKEMEEAYDKQEDEIVKQWKAEHADMGVGSEYQKALRDFLAGLHAQRKEFRAQLQAFRKEFFAAQKEILMNNPEEPVAKPAPKVPAMSIEDAKAKCGPEDDDGRYRTCMRQLLRGVPASAARRSRSNTKILRQGL